jgi:P27 family predicted phage terminase small subunit
MTEEQRSAVGDPPETMNTHGQAMWRYLVGQFDALGDPLSALDRPAFTILCQVGGTAEAAWEDVHGRGVLVRSRSKDHSADDDDGEPYMVKNPAEAVARQATTLFIQLAKEFGMTPAARKRMAVELLKAKPDAGEEELAALIG